MRGLGTVCLVAIALLPFAPAHAVEKGSMIRAGELMAQPFIDAAKSGPLTAKQSVTILQRQGGWVQIEAGGKTGWVRTLNVRLETGGAIPVAAADLTPVPGGGAANPSANSGGRPANARSALNPASLLRTGSSGKTVTTGVKGLEEEDIRNATVNYAELEQLGTLGVDDAEARANAEKSDLKESKVEYLRTRR